MAQNPFDQLSKQYLEEFLAPLGTVQRQYEIPGESKFVDVWFVPNPERVQSGDLGLLGRMVQKPCLLEPYRNVPARTDIRVAVMKLVWIQEDERRKSQQDAVSEDELPMLWILAATTSRPLLEEAGCVTKTDWMPGVYFVPSIFKTAIVAIDQLPETEETLWLRILGRDATQERAIREVLALPPGHPRRNGILRLLSSWKVRIDLSEIRDFSEREAVMALSEAFLEWERQHEELVEQRVKQGIALKLLAQGLPIEVIAQTTELSIEDLQRLQAQSNS
ncbi:hypothetical protein LEP3755_20790 [Leptolyngbya sp. NIES-3755]|nr:hypothetical protein LEP3755_20790 [Leptolyngbya sp. NIES-3755]